MNKGRASGRAIRPGRRGPVGDPRSERIIVFDKLGNLADVLRNPGKIREALERATESLGQVQAEGTAGGGAVTARANGRLEVLSVRIDPKLLADGDAELLEDLVALAVNQALTKAREAAAQSIQSAAGGFPIPPGMGGLFGP
jgi:DNA-binding YbaB/EbfC family protein